MTEPTAAPLTDVCRLLTLDGGGAKGFYTLGVLKEMEAMIGTPLCKKFDSVFGTSTGAIIAALLAFGKTVEEIHGVYKDHLPTIMRAGSSAAKSKALQDVASMADTRRSSPGSGALFPMPCKHLVRRIRSSTGRFSRREAEIELS